MTKRKKVKRWVKEHKKELIIAGAGTAVAVGVVVVVRNPQIVTKAGKSIKGMTSKAVSAKGGSTPKVNVVHTPTNTPKPKNIININDAMKDLKGNRLTATELGKKAGNMSGREINKKLVEAGFAERLPNGELYATELGKKFGETIVRSQPWGYDAYVYGWDEKVLDLLFTKEEWAEIVRRNEYIAKVARELAKEAV